MSHFSVLVISNSPEEVEKLLEPFQENNMGTCPQEYLKFEEDEDANFDEKVGKRGYWYNSRAKWDWWQIGGRWTGLLTPAYDPTEDPANKETCLLCQGTGMRNDEIGQNFRLKNPDYKCNGCDGAGIKTKWPTSWRRHTGDQVQVKDLDLVKALKIAQEKRAKHWAEEEARYNEQPFKPASLDDVTLSFNEALKLYDTWWQEFMESNMSLSDRMEKDAKFKELHEAVNASYFASGIPRGFHNKSAYVEAAIPFSTFAVVKDGDWYARGDMGWWGVTSNESLEQEWNDKYHQLIKSLSPETWLTVVDCHI